ncbi:sigma-54 dependent transcriptional regulator [Zoogloeaceae bacterium G21618-S1]|nr:sigma-54 dependent transcriptional regulator [Zoogloeaceae bacterium G21618-S1]
MTASILMIEDDTTIRVTVGGFLTRRGYQVHEAEDGAAGIEIARHQRVDLVLLDLRLPDMGGLDVLAALNEMGCDAPVVIITAFPELQTAIGALRAGAYDYIHKPFDLEDLRQSIERALETRRLRHEVEWRRVRGNTCRPDGLIGQSAAFRECLMVTERIACAGRVPVLIRGESGTGKERVAQTIHCRSDRMNGAWIDLNCSALPEGLLEAELFGYEKGAFTDAKQMKRGLLELADGGTLFLDEIGDLSPALQPKLLRVLETQTFRRLGGYREIQVDVRFVSATNRDLAAMVAAGSFREDLYYRLNVGTIDVPPLRNRPDDILPLVEHFLAEIAPVVQRRIARIDPQAAYCLTAYAWPGNVRELRNVVERAAILCASDTLTLDALPAELRHGAASDEPAAKGSPMRALSEVERDHILFVMAEVEGNKTHAAEILGITRLTLRTKLRAYGLENADG